LLKLVQDNRSQFTSRDFVLILRTLEDSPIRTSYRHPQRFKTVTPLSIQIQLPDSNDKSINHVAYRVDDLDKSILEAKKKGIRFNEETFRTNPKGRFFIYMHLVSTSGTLIELCEYPT
jgi:methylmalonyl-CoA/ethylmalonyl-CoA epimerase